MFVTILMMCWILKQGHYPKFLVKETANLGTWWHARRPPRVSICGQYYSCSKQNFWNAISWGCPAYSLEICECNETLLLWLSYVDGAVDLKEVKWMTIVSPVYSNRVFSGWWGKSERFEAYRGFDAPLLASVTWRKFIISSCTLDWLSE